MSKSLVCFVAACLCAVALAQNNTQSAFNFPNVQDVLGSAGAIVGSVQAQQMMSSTYAKAILNIQTASGWLQVAQAWTLQALQEAKASPSFEEDARNFEEDNNASLEEDATLKQVQAMLSQSKSRNLEEFFPYSSFAPILANPSSEGKFDAKSVELQGEHALLWLTKLWHIQAANKLSETQRNHYQSKVQMMLLQASGSQAHQLMYLSYYRTLLSSLSSMITIQKQDAMSTWVTHDLLETVVDGLDSNGGYVSLLTTAQNHALAALYTEALLDVQIWYIDQFINSLIARAAAGQPAAASSFLEEEETANPEKPFFPFMAAGNPGYFAYYLSYMRLYSKFLYLQATQSLYTAAQLDLTNMQSTDSNKASKYEYYSREVFTRFGVPALYQWAQINNMLAYYEMYSMYASAYAQPQQPAYRFGQAAAMTDLLQTESQTTAPQEPVESLIAPKIENEQASAPAVAPATAPVAADVDPVAPQQPQSLIG